ncbi:hypothetical protein KY285_009431 [Solanum tuberosum]|nr:hypothetical protein KY285_009431 [Solanum tuberosum]
MAAVWISLPRLSPDLFAKRSLLSMASAVGRPIAIDKETQDKTRPSTARVKNQDTNRKDNGVVGDEQFNGEKFQVSNPKLSTAGVLSGKDSSLATIKDSGQANKVQQCEENLDRISESGGTYDHDFTLKDNDKRGWTEVPSKTFSPGNTKLQQLDCTNLTRKEQTMNCEDKVTRKVVCSNTFDALMVNSDQELHALSTPIHQVSNLETTRIIKESHATMLNKENSMVKPLMATINTSNHDAPNSPSESLREKIFGQQSISKRNDKSLGKGTSDSKWTDLVEEEEHISAPARSKLSPQAPIFVPSSKANSSLTLTIDNSKKFLTITTKVLEKSHESEDGVSRLSPTTTYDSDLGSEKFDDNDEDEMLDILFDKVAKDGDLLPRQQRSGSNKNKKKTHERQHSWDGKFQQQHNPVNPKRSVEISSFVGHI